MISAGQRAELAIDERDQFARQVIRIIADGGGIDVLIAAESGEAIGKDDDGGSHLALVDETRGAVRHIVGERTPSGMRQARAGAAYQIEQHREAPPRPALARALVVLRRQPDRQLAHVWIAERIVLEYLGVVLHHDERPGLA